MITWNLPIDINLAEFAGTLALAVLLGVSIGVFFTAKMRCR